MKECSVAYHNLKDNAIHFNIWWLASLWSRMQYHVSLASSETSCRVLKELLQCFPSTCESSLLVMKKRILYLHAWLIRNVFRRSRANFWKGFLICDIRAAGLWTLKPHQHAGGLPLFNHDLSPQAKTEEFLLLWPSARALQSDEVCL